METNKFNFVKYYETNYIPGTGNAFVITTGSLQKGNWSGEFTIIIELFVLYPEAEKLEIKCITYPMQYFSDFPPEADPVALAKDFALANLRDSLLEIRKVRPEIDSLSLTLSDETNTKLT